MGDWKGVRLNVAKNPDGPIELYNLKDDIAEQKNIADQHPETVAKIAYRFFYNFAPTSEYMFFLDAEPKKLLKRVEQRKEREMFETLDALEKVRKKSLNLVKNWIIIDTSGSINQTFSQIENVLNKLDEK